MLQPCTAHAQAKSVQITRALPQSSRKRFQLMLLVSAMVRAPSVNAHADIVAGGRQGIGGPWTSCMTELATTSAGAA